MAQKLFITEDGELGGGVPFSWNITTLDAFFNIELI